VIYIVSISSQRTIPTTTTIGLIIPPRNICKRDVRYHHTVRVPLSVIFRCRDLPKRLNISIKDDKRITTLGQGQSHHDIKPRTSFIADRESVRHQ